MSRPSSIEREEQLNSVRRLQWWLEHPTDSLALSDFYEQEILEPDLPAELWRRWIHVEDPLIGLMDRARPINRVLVRYEEWNSTDPWLALKPKRPKNAVRESYFNALNQASSALNEFGAERAKRIIDLLRDGWLVAEGQRVGADTDDLAERTIVPGQFWNATGIGVSFAQNRIERWAQPGWSAVFENVHVRSGHLWSRVASDSKLLEALTALLPPGHTDDLLGAMKDGDIHFNIFNFGGPLSYEDRVSSELCKAYTDLSTALDTAMRDWLNQGHLQLREYGKSEPLSPADITMAEFDLMNSVMTGAGIPSHAVRLYPAPQSAAAQPPNGAMPKSNVPTLPRPVGRPTRGSEIKAAFENLLSLGHIDLNSSLSQAARVVQKYLLGKNSGNNDGISLQTIRNKIKPLLEECRIPHDNNQ